MSVTAVDKDPIARTITIVAEFEAEVERVWRLWSEPERLALWWGPPRYPAIFTTHELRPGGEVAFYVIGPGGARIDGSWLVRAVEPPRRLEFELRPQGYSTVVVVVEIGRRDDGGSQMATKISFPTDAAMDDLLAIGFDQGMATSIGQAGAALERL
jgi:uncharacterized protein YndB with AHSA1/START domain